MTRAQRQAQRPKFTPRQWPSNPQSIYLLARAERLGAERRSEGRFITKVEASRRVFVPHLGLRATRISAQLGK